MSSDYTTTRVQYSNGVTISDSVYVLKQVVNTANIRSNNVNAVDTVYNMMCLE